MEEHLETLESVLSRLDAAGLRLRREKCKFMLPEMEYLGHTISEHGLQPSSAKIKAITEAPELTNLTQLRSFLGAVNYYGNFALPFSKVGSFVQAFARPGSMGMGN